MSRDQQMVVYRSREVQPIRKDSGSESDNSSSRDSVSPRKSYQQPQPRVLTNDELDRMDRYLALQERAAAINQKRVVQGHTYGNITVTGNARAIRGNLCDDGFDMPFTYKHTYGVGTVHGNGMIWDGDISVSALKAMRQNQSRR